MHARRPSSALIRSAGQMALFLTAMGAAGCCGLLCAPCTAPFGTSPPPPPPLLPPVGSPSPDAGPASVLPGPLTAEATPGRVPGVSKSAGALRLANSVDTPVRGSFVGSGAGVHFVPHQALNAEPLGVNQLVAVHATTGLWLLERKELRRLARLVPPPITAMAVSPDGTAIAVIIPDASGRDRELRVLGYPDLSTRVAVPSVDEPYRMRFSPDGQQVVIASESDYISLISASTGDKRVFDTDEDVNDAIVMPDNPDQVAYASDDDEVVIVDMNTQAKVFSSAALIRRIQEKHFDPKLAVFFERDQMAVAYDPLKERLIGGGDDNLIWQFDGIRAKPPKEPVPQAPIELDGNIREIACCRKGGGFAVALDSLEVVLLNGSGRRTSSVGPLLDSVSSGKIRIALVPDTESILAASSGKLVRWDPGTRSVTLSQDFDAARIERTSELSKDVVFVGCEGRRCVVQRIETAVKTQPDVEAVKVGDAPLTRVDGILVFSGELRALGGDWMGKLRLVFLPSGGGLSSPMDIPGVMSGGKFADKGDGNTYGYLENSGRIFEITALPKGAAQVGRVQGLSGVTAELTWDSIAKKWKVFNGADTELNVLPP